MSHLKVFGEHITFKRGKNLHKGVAYHGNKARGYMYSWTQSTAEFSYVRMIIEYASDFYCVMLLIVDTYNSQKGICCGGI
jgi:hypothetical protein